MAMSLSPHFLAHPAVGYAAITRIRNRADVSYTLMLLDGRYTVNDSRLVNHPQKGLEKTSLKRPQARSRCSSTKRPRRAWYNGTTDAVVRQLKS